MSLITPSNPQADDRFHTPGDLTDEKLAAKIVEFARWGGSPCCPRCGSRSNPYLVMRNSPATPNARLNVFKCPSCKRQYSVTVGTPLAHSRLALRVWVVAVQVACNSPSGISPAPLAVACGVTEASARRIIRTLRRARCASPLLALWRRALRQFIRDSQSSGGSPAGAVAARLARQHLAEIPNTCATSSLRRTSGSEGSIAVSLWPLSLETALSGILKTDLANW